MGFNVLEWFAQESLKFDLFWDTKTLKAPIKLKSTSFVLMYCLLLDISFYGRAEGKISKILAKAIQDIESHWGFLFRTFCTTIEGDNKE